MSAYIMSGQDLAKNKAKYAPNPAAKKGTEIPPKQSKKAAPTKKPTATPPGSVLVRMQAQAKKRG